MSGWIVAGVALAGYVLWTLVWNRRERRRQHVLAAKRRPLDVEEFCYRLQAEGVGKEFATFLWTEFQPYYFTPLTPYPTDRIYSDLRIDPDDIGDIVVRFEKRFDVWLGETMIALPDDPSIREFATVLQRAAQ